MSGVAMANHLGIGIDDDGSVFIDLTHLCDCCITRLFLEPDAAETVSDDLRKVAEMGRSHKTIGEPRGRA